MHPYVSVKLTMTIGVMIYAADYDTQSADEQCRSWRPFTRDYITAYTRGTCKS